MQPQIKPGRNPHSSVKFSLSFSSLDIEKRGGDVALSLCTSPKRKKKKKEKNPLWFFHGQKVVER